MTQHPASSHDGPDFAKIPLFAGLNPVAFKDLKTGGRVTLQQPGTTFVRQGEFSGDFHVVLSGGVSAYRTEFDGSTRVVDSLGPGGWFGEVSALSNQPSLATLRAETPCVVVSLSPALFKSLYTRAQQFRRQVDERYRERSLLLHLRIAPLFRGLSEEDLARLRRDVRFESFKDGQVLARAGEEADAVYLVRSGAVKCVRTTAEGREEIVSYHMANSSFGERCLMQQSRAWPGNYVTMAPSDMLIVPRSIIASSFRNAPQTMQGLERMAGMIAAEESGEDTGLFSRTVEGGSSLTTGPDREELEFMVQKQSAKGGEALVIDLERCVRCNVCVESCVAVHDDHVPRLSKKGNRIALGETDHDRYNLATSCYNCEVPGCMLSCGFGAIRRDVQGLIRFDYENCVGCAACVSACPYDVIRLTSPAPTVQVDAKGIWNAWPFLKRLLGRPEQPTQPAPTPMSPAGVPVRAKAVKCDLCAGLPFEACVYNCPTNAISRVNPAHLFRTGKVDTEGTFSYTRT